MKRLPSGAAILLLALALCQSVFAWTTVGNGIEYQSYTLSDPNNLFVTRMLRSNTNAILDFVLANGKAASTQTVPNQYSTYDAAVFFDGNDWGPRYSMVAAVNGDFFTSGGGSRGIRISNGWQSAPLDALCGAFAWTSDREAIMYGYPNPTETIAVELGAGGSPILVSNVNRAPADGQLCLFTPHIGLTTGTDSATSEVLVQMSSPNLIKPAPASVVGYVRAVYPNTGSTTVPFDCIVLSARGPATAVLLANATVGAQVRISTAIDSYKTDGVTHIGHRWQNTVAGVTGSHVILEDSIVKSYPSESLMTDRHPRTAVAYNSTYVFLVVCDGRDSGVSRGMTGVELGTFCKNTLGATSALNLDGGGSSTMVVNGAVKNNPSDGSPRSVANALVMANFSPKQQSTRFSQGQFVSVSGGSVNFRRGPGTINPAIGVQTGGTVGTITSHRLGGIMTKGGYWWNVNFGGVEGWMSESYLAEYGTSAPTITQQPVGVTICGGEAKLSVAATGSGYLSYRWQKAGVDISDSSDLNGATTPTLAVNVNAGTSGSYRCVVSSAYGTAVSTSADITVGAGASITISQPSATVTRTGSVYYTVTFGNATNINPVVQLIKTGTANAITSVSTISSNQRRVHVIGLSGTGTLTISLLAGSATDPCGRPSEATLPATPFTVDNTLPTGVSVTDGGAYAPLMSSLSATWTAASDASGISGYQYAIGTTPSTTNVRGWTSIGNTLSVNASSLALVVGGAYYVLVRATDSVGNVGPVTASDGILIAPDAGRIGDALSLADSTPFALLNKTVSATTSGAFWLQEGDRSTGLKVLSNSSVSLWDKISIAGCLGMSDGGRVMLGDVLNKTGVSTPVKPLGMSVKSVGGGDLNSHTPGLTGGGSLYNVGLLARCWGKISGADTQNPADKRFYISDGSSQPGLLVCCGDIDPPTSQFAAVTGVVCTSIEGGKVVPFLLVRSADDLRNVY